MCPESKGSGKEDYTAGRGEFIDLGNTLMIQDLVFWQGLLELQF